MLQSGLFLSSYPEDRLEVEDRLDVKEAVSEERLLGLVDEERGGGWPKSRLELGGAGCVNRKLDWLMELVNDRGLFDCRLSAARMRSMLLMPRTCATSGSVKP